MEGRNGQVNCECEDGGAQGHLGKLQGKDEGKDEGMFLKNLPVWAGKYFQSVKKIKKNPSAYSSF